MEPKIEEKEEIKLVGLIDRGKYAGDIDICGLWDDFEKVSKKIKNQIQGVSYEVHIDVDDLGQRHHLCFAGVEVKEIKEIPLSCFVKVLPSSKYAVFTHRFAEGGFTKAFEKVYRWIDTSEYTQSYPFDVQYYDHRFKGSDDPDSVIDIYVPIE